MSGTACRPCLRKHRLAVDVSVGLLPGVEPRDGRGGQIAARLHFSGAVIEGYVSRLPDKPGCVNRPRPA